MNIRRFQAPTAREALALARAAFGDDTLVLSNRQLADGVEVLAATEAELSSIDPKPPTADFLLQTPAVSAMPTLPAASSALSVDRPAPAANEATTHDVVRADTEQLAMSTLSFQDYVRERMLRKQQAAAVRTSGAVAQPPRLSPALASASAVRIEPRAAVAPAADLSASGGLAAAGISDLSNTVMNELRAMKQLMDDRFTTLAWLGQARSDPVHSNLMLRFVRAGYSAVLARAVLEPIAGSSDAACATREVVSTLERMLAVDATTPAMTEEGGVFALVGATGVGKTTTIAKLASHCAATHGTASVGLVTLDIHRTGAHEQLRSFGRTLGIVAHQAHDRAELQELLALLAGKKMVLVDTAGIAPRDPRRREALDMLETPGVKRVLVLNAGAHGDTLEEIVNAFKTGGGARQQAILSKIDEAAKLGPALDILMRHQLNLRGIANGQRIPDDWKTVDARELVRESMNSVQRSPFDAGNADLDFHYSPSACAV